MPAPSTPPGGPAPAPPSGPVLTLPGSPAPQPLTEPTPPQPPDSPVSVPPSDPAPALPPASGAPRVPHIFLRRRDTHVLPPVDNSLTAADTLGIPGTALASADDDDDDAGAAATTGDHGDATSGAALADATPLSSTPEPAPDHAATSHSSHVERSNADRSCCLCVAILNCLVVCTGLAEHVSSWADGLPILAQLPSQQQTLPPSPPAQNPASYNHELSDGQLACSPGAWPVPCLYILAPSPPARNHTSYAHALPGEQSTCGPEARLTGSLHDGGLRSVHSPSQRQLHAPNTVSDMHILPNGWSINTANDSHVQMICQKDILQSDTIWDTINFLQRALRNQLELFGSRRKASLFGNGTALYDSVKRSVPDSGNVITVAQLLRTALVGHGHAAQFRGEPSRPLMLATGVTTLATLLCSAVPASNSRLTLMSRGLRYLVSGGTSSVPLGHLFLSALPCFLAQTAYAMTPSQGAAANNIPDWTQDLSSAVPLDLSGDSDDSTQVGDNGGDHDLDVSLDSHASFQLPDDQSIDSMLDSATSDEVGVVSIDLATESDTTTRSLHASDDDSAPHHPDEIQDYEGTTLDAHLTGATNHHGSNMTDIPAGTIQDADSGSGSGGGTHLAPAQQLGTLDYNDTHFPHPDTTYRHSDANTAAVPLAPPHDRMCSTNNCRRFSRFTFTDFEWPACCTLCYSQGSSSHSSTCDASQGTCTTRGCQRRLNSDPLVGWHPVGERFCCVGCIDSAGARHSATCDATLRSRNDIEPSASQTTVPSRPTATLVLTLMLAPLPLVPRILVAMLTTLATLAHGAPHTTTLGSSISLMPPTHYRLALVFATTTFLPLSGADEQRPPQSPYVTIHVYDPTDHFHTVYTVDQADLGHTPDPSHRIYGDSDSEAALFRSIYGEPSSETPHDPHTVQQSSALVDHPSTQLGDTLTHTDTPASVNTPAYTTFLSGLLAQIRDDTDSESDDSLVPDDSSSADATPAPQQPPIPHSPDDSGTAPSDRPHEETSDSEGAYGTDDSDWRSGIDTCDDASNEGNPLVDYPTCAHYNCNRPSDRPDTPGALCCLRCQPVPHSMHTTSCNRAWIEEMLLDLRHTAPSSQAEPTVARASVARSLAWTTTIVLSLVLSPLPLSYNVPAVVLVYLTPYVFAAPARLPTPPGFDVDADSGHGSGGGAQSDSHSNCHGACTTPSASVTVEATIAPPITPHSTDAELPAIATLADILIAGSDGFLTPYDGTRVPCEVPDCPYVASIIAGDFVALCCYDCALHHTHSCSRTPFPLDAGATSSAASTSVAVPDGHDSGGDDVATTTHAMDDMTPDTLPDTRSPNPCGLLTAAQLAGMARQPGQSASNADVCDIAAAIAASLADLRTDTPVATLIPAAPLGISSSATTAAPAIWDDSSGANVPGPASTHVESLRALSGARARQSDLATAHVASLTSLTYTERSDALHLYRISSDAALLATSADVVVTLYGFIAQATNSLQHLQQQYDEQSTPDSAAALDVARLALTHGLAALHGVMPLSVLLPYGDRYGTPYFTHRDLLLDDPSEQHTPSQRTSSSRCTGPTPMLLLFALVASTVFIAQLSVSATVHATQSSASAPHGPAASAKLGPTAPFTSSPRGLAPAASATSSPTTTDDNDGDEPVQPPDYVIAAAVSCVPGYRVSGNARTMPSHVRIAHRPPAPVPPLSPRSTPPPTAPPTLAQPPGPSPTSTPTPQRPPQQSGAPRTHPGIVAEPLTATVLAALALRDERPDRPRDIARTATRQARQPPRLTLLGGILLLAAAAHSLPKAASSPAPAPDADRTTPPLPLTATNEQGAPAPAAYAANLAHALAATDIDATTQVIIDHEVSATSDTATAGHLQSGDVQAPSPIADDDDGATAQAAETTVAVPPPYLSRSRQAAHDPKTRPRWRLLDTRRWLAPDDAEPLERTPATLHRYDITVRDAITALCYHRPTTRGALAIGRGWRTCATCIPSGVLGHEPWQCQRVGAITMRWELRDPWSNAVYCCVSCYASDGQEHDEWNTTESGALPCTSEWPWEILTTLLGPPPAHHQHADPTGPPVASIHLAAHMDDAADPTEDADAEGYQLAALILEDLRTATRHANAPTVVLITVLHLLQADYLAEAVAAVVPGLQAAMAATPPHETHTTSPGSPDSQERPQQPTPPSPPRYCYQDATPTEQRPPPPFPRPEPDTGRPPPPLPPPPPTITEEHAHDLARRMAREDDADRIQDPYAALPEHDIRTNYHAMSRQTKAAQDTLWMLQAHIDHFRARRTEQNRLDRATTRQWRMRDWLVRNIDTDEAGTETVRGLPSCAWNTDLDGYLSTDTHCGNTDEYYWGDHHWYDQQAPPPPPPPRSDEGGVFADDDVPSDDGAAPPAPSDDGSVFLDDGDNSSDYYYSPASHDETAAENGTVTAADPAPANGSPYRTSTQTTEHDEEPAPTNMSTPEPATGPAHVDNDAPADDRGDALGKRDDEATAEAPDTSAPSTQHPSAANDPVAAARTDQGTQNHAHPPPNGPEPAPKRVRAHASSAGPVQTALQHRTRPEAMHASDAARPAPPPPHPDIQIAQCTTPGCSRPPLFTEGACCRDCGDAARTGTAPCHSPECDTFHRDHPPGTSSDGDNTEPAPPNVPHGTYAPDTPTDTEATPPPRPLSLPTPAPRRTPTPTPTRPPSQQAANAPLMTRTGSSRRTRPTPMLLLFALVASTVFIAQLSVSATIHTTQPSTSAPHGPAASATSGPTTVGHHASAASASAGPTVLPEGSGIPIQADETRAGVADLSVTARTTGDVRSDTLATNARTHGTGPTPSRRGDEHAMREALHQRRIPFRRSPTQTDDDDDDDDEPVQPPDYVIAAAVSCVPGYRVSGNARTMPSRGTRSPGSVTGANNAAAVGLVLFKRHDIDDTHSFWSEESTARMQLGLEVAGRFEFASPITAAKAQLLAMVMAVLWVRRFRSLPLDTTVAYITSNDSHVQMIRQGGMSESESLWNAIDFLQRAFEDQPELFGSRGMESLFGTGTALYDATKRLVPDSGNAITSTERGLEYAPLIAAALTECVFFDAGVPGPIRKAHELWTAARVEVCKNHVAGQQFEAQRSATTEASSDRASGTPGGDGTVGHDDHSDNADRRTRRRLAGASALTDDTAVSLPGSLPSSSPVAPPPAPSAVAPIALVPAHDQATVHTDGGDTSVLTLSGTHHGTNTNGTSAVPLATTLTGTGGADAPGMPAPSGAGPGAQ